MCDCNRDVNTELAKHNGRLLEAFVFGVSKLSTSLIISTEKIDAKKRVRIPHVFPSYCPFCGEKYPSRDAAALDRAETKGGE